MLDRRTQLTRKPSTREKKMSQEAKKWKEKMGRKVIKKKSQEKQQSGQVRDHKLERGK